VINYRFYYFGPHVFHVKLDKEFCNKMLSFKGTNCKTSLAGHFEEEYYIIDEGRKYFMKHLNDKTVIEAYKQSFQHFYNEAPPDNLNLINMWINYMKAGDFNPSHIHSDDLSFVFFVKTDEQILEENKQHKGTDGAVGPGSLSFHWGEPIVGFIDTKSFVPEEGDLIIFPAKLRHMVYPFKSNAERITIAGNFRLEKYDTI
tara:strand:- start:97 stop:699 length:603 start_codon:yes stop_codon:yes gene_type:complete